MPDLREQLQHCLHGRVCLMGLGNVDYGDDGFGVHLAGRLRHAGVPHVIVAEAAPEQCMGRIADRGFDHVVFLDAVEFGGESGAVIFLDAAEIVSRFPQLSTHKLSLGTLAKWIGAGGVTRVWLLGVQPASIRPAECLTPALQITLEALEELLRGLMLPRQPQPAQATTPATEANA
jgi:hydrogenase maturation protease